MKCNRKPITIYIFLFICSETGFVFNSAWIPKLPAVALKEKGKNYNSCLFFSNSGRRVDLDYQFSISMFKRLKQERRESQDFNKNRFIGSKQELTAIQNINFRAKVNSMLNVHPEL
ncbi:uncharacterized protein LOC116502866 isoform X2 [Thamnophis elegans]|uniref:uncharacterized protein LOC116502866 isoform X2 n=1 Tax=Thamnophis elegans TaxID=35005 RepID=UPI001377288B|nr:uncharacterized protein LOC116502866 isoform X2 [Thamnophis elegans]